MAQEQKAAEQKVQEQLLQEQKARKQRTENQRARRGRRSLGAAGCGALLLLGGCMRPESREVSHIKIGVSLYDQYDTFLSELMDVFNASASALEEEKGISINIEVLDASGSQSTQNEAVERLIARGCDVICVNLVDRTEPTTITDMAEKNDVPIIFFNRELVEEDLERWEKLYYVGADAFQSGVMQGELAAEAFLSLPGADRNGDGVCQYFILEGEAGHQDSIVRTEYSVNTMMELGVKMEKLGYAIANWNRAQAQTKTASMLAQYSGEVELILANNDDMALGAIDALKAARIPQDERPIVIGIDGTEEGLQAVENGDMYATVYNDKEGQANKMLELAFDLATGADLDDLELEDGKYIRLSYYKIRTGQAEEES